MLSALRGATGKVLVIYPADPEAQIFARRCAAIISEAGWQVCFTLLTVTNELGLTIDEYGRAQGFDILKPPQPPTI